MTWLNDHPTNGNGHGASRRGFPFRKSDSPAPPAAQNSAAGYRHLALQLYYDLPEPRSVLLTTAGGGDYSTEGSASLAISLAEEIGRPVLLIDGDPHVSSVSGMLGCETGQGLTELLHGSTPSLTDLAINTNSEHVFFLPSGKLPDSMMAGWPERLEALLKDASKHYAFVVVAGGSILENSIALAAAPWVGCVLLLVGENETEKEDLESARLILNRCHAQKCHLVFMTEGSAAARNGA